MNIYRFILRFFHLRFWLANLGRPIFTIISNARHRRILEQRYPNIYLFVQLVILTKQHLQKQMKSGPCSRTACLALLWNTFFFGLYFCVYFQTLQNKWKVVRPGTNRGGAPSLLSLHRSTIRNQLSFVNFKLTIGEMWDWRRCYWQILLWNSAIHLYKTLRGFLQCLFTTLIFFILQRIALFLPRLKHGKAGKLVLRLFCL